MLPSASSGYGFTPERIPGAVALGSDGGGEGIVFDLRPQHPDGYYPIVAVNFVSVNWRETIHIADSFRDLLLLRRPLLED
jgi:hypothetical protein